MKIGGDRCAIEHYINSRNDQPSAYRNVNWALFCVIDRFWENSNATKVVKDEGDA
jgi:hypothetical protein